jgi:hypothetical protein
MAKGKKTGGRKEGTPNKVGADLKQSILDAAELAGEKHGAEGIKSYLAWAAKEHPAPFISLLGKVLPLQIKGDDGQGGGIVFKMIYEAKKAHEGD